MATLAAVAFAAMIVVAPRRFLDFGQMRGRLYGVNQY
jgi:hypothetical protein